jgi:predicted RNA binding protein YcfA (HicA-like mRNA interferase family)
MPRSCSADDVFRALRKHDKGFEIHERRGKGSHRMIFHRPSGQQFPVPYHKGCDLGKPYLKAIIRRFNLPEDFFG